MVVLAKLFVIIMVASTLLSFWFGMRKLYRWLRKWHNKRKPTE